PSTGPAREFRRGTVRGGAATPEGYGPATRPGNGQGTAGIRSRYVNRNGGRNGKTDPHNSGAVGPANVPVRQRPGQPPDPGAHGLRVTPGQDRSPDLPGPRAALQPATRLSPRDDVWTLTCCGGNKLGNCLRSVFGLVYHCEQWLLPVC